MMGWPGKIALKCIFEDFNTSEDFLAAKCYKLVSSDPMDTSIPDLAS